MKGMGVGLWLRRAAVALFAPRDALCAFCGADAEDDPPCVCAACAQSLPQRPDSFAPIAGLDGWAAAFHYEEPIRSLIHRLKYDNRRYLARFAAFAMAEALAGLNLPKDAVLVPVPLHRRRRRERTFNQSEELARELCALTGHPFLAGALLRIRNTKHQTRLNAAERKVNLLGAFVAKRTVANRCAILVDDVSTTGSTLKECAHALRAAGAAQVYAIVLAGGRPDAEPDREITA